MADEKELTATQRLFKEFWQKQGPGQPIEAIVLSLEMLSECYEQTVTPSMVRPYIAALEDCTEDEIVLGFSRAVENCKYWPSPATLREFSGRPASGDPVVSAAKDELLKLIIGMRGPHGPTLKPILGAFLYGKPDDPKDAGGNRVPHCDAPRGESTLFPIARRTEAALVRLGWGDRTAGIALIADHPAVKRKVDSGDEQFKQNQLRAGDELLKRFVDAYREV